VQIHLGCQETLGREKYVFRRNVGLKLKFIIPFFRAIRESREQGISDPDEIYLIHAGLGIAWAGVLVFDSVVFGMTLYKFIILPRANRVSIMDILLRDGERYHRWKLLFCLNLKIFQGQSTLGMLRFSFLIPSQMNAYTG